MTVAFKNFTLNNPGDDSPWSDDEQQAFKDIINTLVLDCITVGKDTTRGHQHSKMYFSTTNVGIRVQAQGNVRNEFNSSNYLTTAVNSSGDVTLTPSGGDLDIAANTVIIKPSGSQLSLQYDSSNKMDIAVGSGGDVTITPSGGTVALAGDATITKITQQLSLRYDASNRLDVTVGVAGLVTLAPSTGNVRLNSSLGINTEPSFPVDINQFGSGAAVECIRLTQADVDRGFVLMQGTAASADLTRSIVDTGDVNTPTLVGYAKINITDDGNQVTDGFYFLPFYSLA